MDKEKQILINECTNKVSRNDLPYEYIKRTITELVEKCEGKDLSMSENEAEICPRCHKHKRLQGNGIMHQLCECTDINFDKPTQLDLTARP